MSPQDLIIALIGVALLFYLLWPRPGRKATRPKPRGDALPRNAIVVDGSNIMFWGGDPSAKVLNHVIGYLTKKGFSPVVIFDASAGYHLSDRFMSERDFAHLTSLPERQILVVNKGVVADEVILDFATEHTLRVITNDRYRDWSVQFPMVKQKGRLLKGTFKNGNVAIPGL